MLIKYYCRIRSVLLQKGQNGGSFQGNDVHKLVCRYVHFPAQKLQISALFFFFSSSSSSGKYYCTLFSVQKHLPVFHFWQHAPYYTAQQASEQPRAGCLALDVAVVALAIVCTRSGQSRSVWTAIAREHTAELRTKHSRGITFFWVHREFRNHYPPVMMVPSGHSGRGNEKMISVVWTLAIKEHQTERVFPARPEW